MVVFFFILRVPQKNLKTANGSPNIICECKINITHLLNDLKKQRGFELNFCNALDCLDSMFHVIAGKIIFIKMMK